MYTTISKRGFAEIVGRDEKLIRRLIQQGKLPCFDDGQIPLETALQAFEEYEKTKRHSGRTKEPEYITAADDPELWEMCKDLDRMCEELGITDDLEIPE